jgi:hypothetical protein
LSLKNQALLIGSTCLAILLGAPVQAQAAPITVAFAGQWTAQGYGIYPMSSAVTSAPVSFTASVTFDPANAIQPYLNATYDFSSPNYYPPYLRYSIVIPTPAMTSSTMSYATINPYASSGVMSNNSAGLGRDELTTPGPNQSFSFSQSLSSQQETQYGMGYWSTTMSIWSQRVPLYPDDYLLVRSEDLVDKLRKSMTSGEKFTTQFSSIAWTVGMPIFEGFQLAGTAQITSITEVPEPVTATLFLGGLAAAALARHRKGTPAGTGL